jgi:hypothetical protein
VRKIPGGERRQRFVEAHRRSVEQLAGARIALYGLPVAWHGGRYLAASCFERVVDRSSGRTEADYQSVELGHDDGRGGYLGVTSSDRGCDVVEGFDAMIAIDGVPHRFRVRRTPHAVIARRIETGLTITVTARHWPVAGLTLERVTDPGPYLDGRKVLLEQRSGFRLE